MLFSPGHTFPLLKFRRAAGLCLLFLGFFFCACGQNPQEAYLRKSVEQHIFDRGNWKALTKDIDYSKDKVEKQQKPAAKKRTSPEFAAFFKYFAIVCGVAVLVWLIVNMAKGEALFGPRNRKLNPAASGIDLEAIEDNLPQAELQDPIRQAVLAGDYALAVRLHYLVLLKELSLKKHIKWQREKTNGEYLRELQASPLFPGVMEATLIFERVWYGKVTLEKEDFLHLEKKFRNTAKAI
jgi:Domain of unknown function (DUF4129)